jgi:hypothetical protein
MKTAREKTQRILNDPRPAKIRATALAEFDSQLWAAVREVFHQTPFLSVTDWAAQNRYLTGAESGRYIRFAALTNGPYRMPSTIPRSERSAGRVLSGAAKARWVRIFSDTY